jgi:hypothetical protein
MKKGTHGHVLQTGIAGEKGDCGVSFPFVKCKKISE